MEHIDIPSAQCHEPKHITDAITSDSGKVITPSASTPAVSVLRFLGPADVTGLVAALAAKASLVGAETLTNKRITRRVSNVAYAASLGVDSDLFDELACDALTANVTITAPTGTPVDGQRLSVRLTQNATGGWTVTWDAAFVGATATASTPNTTSNWTFEWHAARAKWIEVHAKVDV